MNELYIYDEIGPEYWGLISAAAVVRELKAMEGPLTVRINSPGGDVNEADAIYNALARYDGKVTVEIDGTAASAASYIAMAGNEIRIAENAKVMVHDPWTIAVGNASELSQVASVLMKFGDSLAAAYSARSGLDVAKVREMMAEETWMNAQEAVELGFADSIGQPLRVAACVRPGMFLKVPDDSIYDGSPKRQKNVRSSEMISRKIQLTKARLNA